MKTKNMIYAKLFLIAIPFIVNLQSIIIHHESQAQNPEWIVYDTSNSGLPNNFITSIAIDANGNKWIGTWGGVAKFDNTNWTVYNSSNTGFFIEGVTTITIDVTDNIWIVANYEGLLKFDGTNWTEINSGWWSFDNDAIYRTAAIDLNSIIWMGYEIDFLNGLAKFDGTNWTYYYTTNSGIPSDWVYSIAIDTDGSKWIGTAGGLAQFDDTNWTVYNTSNSGLPSDYIRTITIDGSGNKWIGTVGLVKFDGTNWTVYDTSNSDLPDNFVRSIADENGIIWVAASGLAKFDGTNWSIYDTSNSDLPSDLINSIAIDASGNKWIGTNNGLAVYKEGGVSIDENIYPKDAILYSNYPNPVYQSTTFRFYLPEKSDVSLIIFDLQGKEIETLLKDSKPQGEYSIDFNARSLESGIYFYRLQTDSYNKTMKMIILK